MFRDLLKTLQAAVAVGLLLHTRYSSQVVGSSYTTHMTELGPSQHAFIWQNGVMTDLGVRKATSRAGPRALTGTDRSSVHPA
jgi:probable HAF family extracellular repeat protein